MKRTFARAQRLQRRLKAERRLARLHDKLWWEERRGSAVGETLVVARRGATAAGALLEQGGEGGKGRGGERRTLTCNRELMLSIAFFCACEEGGDGDV